MLELEERLEALEKKVEELTSEVASQKKEPEEDSGLISGAEYDFVPSVPDKVIGTFTVRVGRIIKESSLLALTDEEWAQYAKDEE